MRSITIVVAAMSVLLGGGAGVASAARPPQTVTTGSAAVSAVAVTPNSQTSNYSVVPVADVAVTGRYAVNDDGCPGCRDQIQIGWAGSSAPRGCIFDGGSHHKGTFSFDLGAPPPSNYVSDVVVNFSQGTSCPTDGWWSSNQGPVIAEVATTPPDKGINSYYAHVSKVKAGVGNPTNVKITDTPKAIRVTGTYNIPKASAHRYYGLTIGWASDPDGPAVCIGTSSTNRTGTFSITLPAPPAEGANYIALGDMYSTASFSCNSFTPDDGWGGNPYDSSLVGLVYDSSR